MKQSQDDGKIQMPRTQSQIDPAMMKKFAQSEIRPQRGVSPQDNDPESSSNKVIESLKIQNIKFISEKDYQKDPKCKICCSIFGNFQYRQHHCRLCAQSVCDYCSMKRVNDQRVCDVCFLKLKNLSGEKRKKKLLKTIKNYVQTISQNVVVGQKEINSLEKNIQEFEKECEEKSQQKEQQRQKLQGEFYKKIIIQGELLKIEEDRNRMQELIEKFDKEYKPKQNKVKDLQAELEKLESDYKIIETEIAFKIQNLQGKQNHYSLLSKSKKEIENSDDFSKLPNYQKAKKFSEGQLSEAILSLDKQYPPELEVQQKSESTSSTNPGTGGPNSLNMYKVSYQEEFEKSILVKQDRSESNASQIKTHTIRPKGDKFMCYI